MDALERQLTEHMAMGFGNMFAPTGLGLLGGFGSTEGDTDPTEGLAPEAARVDAHNLNAAAPAFVPRAAQPAESLSANDAAPESTQVARETSALVPPDTPPPPPGMEQPTTSTLGEAVETEQGE